VKWFVKCSFPQGGNMQYTILIVEDQREIRDIVMRYLEREGHHVLTATNGFEALEIYHQSTVHLLILDIMMPGIDGFDVLKTLREVSSVPVMMLTARMGEEDKIVGFDLGADDYIVKPFSARELVRRVKAILKRCYGEQDQDVLAMGDLTLNLRDMTLFKSGHGVILTAQEFSVMKVFFQHQNQILTREQLIENAFGHAYEGVDRNVDSCIKRIRQKIEDDPKNPHFLKTKYGTGYVFGGNYDHT